MNSLFGITTKNIYRPLLYSGIIFFIFYLLITIPYKSNDQMYFILSFIGGIVILLESFFSVYHINIHNEKKTILEDYKFFHHGINHTLYPLFYYIGFLTFAYFKENYILSYLLAVVSFFLFFVHFYLLPIHMIGLNEDKHLKMITHVRIDFVMYVFKFLSYFIVNLALFELLYLNVIGIQSLIVINFLINSLYLISHLNRREEVSFMNLFITYLFAFLTTIFIIKSKTDVTDFSAVIATLIFYLTSGIYYHKVDGTFTYKVLVEYASLAIILSVFLVVV